MDGPQHKENPVAKGSPVNTSDLALEPSQFGSALRDLALSLRSRIAEASLAAVLPLATVGLTGTSIAHESKDEGLPARVAAMNPEQPLTRQTLSEDDATTLIHNFADSKGTREAITSLLADHHEDHQPRHLGADGSSWARTLSGTEALSLLQRISNDTNDRRSTQATTLLSEVDAMLTSPIFQQGVTIIKETNPQCKAPIGEMSAVWSRPSADIEQFLHILKSAGFKEYQSSVTAATGADLQNKLASVVWQYTEYSTDPKKAVGPTLKSAVDQFREKIPELPLRDISDLRPIFLNSSPEEEGQSEIATQAAYDTWLEKVRSGFDVLTGQYSIPIRSLAELHADFLTPTQLSYLQQQDVNELSRYLATTYPTLDVGSTWTPKFLLHSDGFINGFALPILTELQTDGPTMRRFLALYGKDLGEVSLASISPRMLQDVPLPLEELVKDKAFTEFLDQQFERYPSLQPNLSTEQIFQLAAAFADRGTYEALNAELSKRAALTLPDLSLGNGALKKELLQTLEQVGFDRITVESPQEPAWGLFKVDRAVQALQSPEARQLYDALHTQWGLEKFDVADFCHALTAPDTKLEFLLNTENSRTFAAIRSLYPAPPPSSNDADTPHALARYAPEIVSQAHIFLRKDLADYRRRYDPRLFERNSNGESQTSLYRLAETAKYDSALVSDLQKFQAAATVLEERYGMEPLAAGEAVGHAGDINRFLETLQSPKVAGLYDALDGAFLDSVGASAAKEPFRKSLTTTLRLDLAKRLSAADDIGSTIRSVSAAGQSITTADSLGYLIQECYDNQAVRRALQDPNFVQFVRELDQRFFGGTVQLSRFREYEELYSELRDVPGTLDTLLSPEFKQLTSFLGQQFQVATEQPSTLRPCLRVSKDLDMPAFTQLIEQLKQQGEAISSNDIVLLSEISKNPSLYNKLTDRQTLLEGLDAVYQRTAFPRRHLDKLSEIPDPATVSDERGKQRAIEQRKAISDAYTERPPLAELSNLQLLRITMIDEMLKRADVREHLGSLITKDIATQTTELGGAIVVQEGRAALREHQSSASNNGNFSSYKYDNLIDGLATFHLHALDVDNSEYTGPSGWLGMPLADIGYVERFNLTDTVFTAMGHPTNDLGEPMTDSIRVNTDVYFVDKRDPRKSVLRIIDLGETIVPFNP